MDALATLGRLARHAVSPAVEPAAIGPLAVDLLAFSLLDLFGCFLAARQRGMNASVETVVRALGGAPEAALWGTSERLPAGAVALAAGTIAHHLELDGGWHGPPGVGVHPAITILPAALATADRTDASGGDFIAASAAGYDVLAAMATWLCPGITAYKLHPPGMLGHFGSTTAAARLLGHDQARVEGALAWCGGVAPLSPFESFTAGASTKDLYGGWPGAIGAMLAGYPPPVDPAFTLPLLLGRAEFDVSSALAQLAEPALLGADFKPFCTCRSVQPALTALEQLLAAHPMSAADVAKITVETYPYAVELDRAAATDRPIGARTSVRTCLALLLINGHLGPAHFTADQLTASPTRALADRISVGIGRYAARALRGAVVTVWLRDGRCLSREVDAAKWSDRQPAGQDELLHKFRTLAGPALRPPDIETLIHMTLDLERLPSIRPLLELLGRAGFPPAGEGADTGLDGPAQHGLEQRLAGIERRVRTRLRARGGNPDVLFEVLAAARAASQRHGLGAERCQAAVSVALSLAPCGAGPVPASWPDLLGDLSARLAAVGFSGPSGVIDGARGVGSLLAGIADAGEGLSAPTR